MINGKSDGPCTDRYRRALAHATSSPRPRRRHIRPPAAERMAAITFAPHGSEQQKVFCGRKQAMKNIER